MTTEPRPLPAKWMHQGIWIFDDDGERIVAKAALTHPDYKANAALIARAPELLARVAELEQLLRWHPIETAPKQRVLLLFGYYEDGNWKKSTGSIHPDGSIEWDGMFLKPYDLQPTHWMHLPESPQKEMSK